MNLSAASIIRQFVPQLNRLPEDFARCVAETAKGAYYLVSCAYGEKMLYVSPSFKALTGYEPGQFQQGGLRFWFPLIHPIDLAAVTKTIADAQQKLLSLPLAPQELGCLQLEYRLRRTDGEWVWLREHKWIVEFTSGGVKDKILCFLEDATAQKAQHGQAIQELLRKEKNSHPLLEAAVQYQEATHNPLLLQIPRTETLLELEQAKKLTRREKEVLLLLASGLSTKEIASQLFISDNTVETHRRHLLQKFGVKNSVELIGQASKLFWV